MKNNIKRVISLFLCAVLCLCFAGCNKKTEKEESKKAVIDLEYYAKLGQMPETEHALGSDTEALTEALENAAAAHESEEERDHSAPLCETIDYGDYTSIYTGNIEYCYLNDKQESGISCIISYTDAYKFASGTIITEVKNGLTAFECKEYDTTGDEVFFLPGNGPCTVLKYSFEKCDIAFIFVDNALTATAVYYPDDWKI